ncbi:HAMP domain-containing sensor histidine kinase [Scopulibacillus cellulosilyticus]|uniref:histidine kinase n=1 Tax=Scopulibacillus cellulosilyticus TaxID=2665665 RepID=A0ABW2Q275_9BACL
MSRQRFWFRISTTIFCLLLAWTAAYFLTDLIYHAFNIHIPKLAVQLINSFLGILLIACTMFIIAKYTGIQRKQFEFLQSLITAIEQMSKGDFNVHLPASVYGNEKDHPVGKIAASINHMAVELREIEQLRQEFVSNVSHEIQSPLTSISGFAQALKNEELTSESRRHYLDIIETESKRLSKLSDNLLKLTSLESEHHPFEASEYRLDQQLRSIILACEPQWIEKNIKMDIDLNEATITADKDLLSQVWVNLINNSIKFTPENGTISISLWKKQNQVLVRISDSGIGISQEDAQHIFERFFKADKSRNRVRGGNGLGLSIVKKIVDMHKGTIQVDSELGKGTAFIITLPKTQ